MKTEELPFYLGHHVLWFVDFLDVCRYFLLDVEYGKQKEWTLHRSGKMSKKF